MPRRLPERVTEDEGLANLATVFPDAVIYEGAEATELLIRLDHQSSDKVGVGDEQHARELAKSMRAMFVRERKRGSKLTQPKQIHAIRCLHCDGYTAVTGRTTDPRWTCIDCGAKRSVDDGVEILETV